jgi:RND superfamily putative drug exporter
MVCVFLSFTLGDERTLKEFGFGLAVAVLLDALVVRCVLLPAVLQLLGKTTWQLPRWLDARLPHINIEGSTARALPVLNPTDVGETPDPDPVPT